MTSSDDARELDGVWEMVHGEHRGGSLPDASVLRGRMAVADGRFSLRLGADALRGTLRSGRGEGFGWVEAVVVEGPNRGALVLGLYAQDGCRLKIGVAPPGQKRPSDLDSAEFLYVWEALTDIVKLPPRWPRGARPLR